MLKVIVFYDLTKLLEDYWKRKQCYWWRIHFGSRNQQENESVTDFILVLKKVRTNCEFGDSLWGTDFLLVYGVQQ